nr:MAG TPA: hypothetical protein [Caudoviricetes sp.]
MRGEDLFESGAKLLDTETPPHAWGRLITISYG